MSRVRREGVFRALRGTTGVREVPCSAEHGQRYAALDPRRLLEKAGENFEKRRVKVCGTPGRKVLSV